MFWIALLLLVLVIFFFNRERIMTVFKETGFSDYIVREKPSEPEVKRVSPLPGKPDTPTEEDTVTITPAEEKPEETLPSEEEKTDAEQQTNQNEEEVGTPDTEGPDTLVDKRMRKSAVYFVRIGDDASIELKKIIRPVYYTDSPLTETIKTLLEGLTAEELNSGLLSLIPQNTVLNRVWIENGIAYLDFSESLKFNQFGSEGLQAELRQIVYTATEFQTVEAVQILINGEHLDYLSSEGIFIGKPLNRQDVF